MSKRTRRERRLNRAQARAAELKAQAELLSEEEMAPAEAAESEVASTTDVPPAEAYSPRDAPPPLVDSPAAEVTPASTPPVVSPAAEVVPAIDLSDAPSVDSSPAPPAEASPKAEVPDAPPVDWSPAADEPTVEEPPEDLTFVELQSPPPPPPAAAQTALLLEALSPMPLDLDEEERITSPVEFEMVMVEERPKKTKSDKRTSRVRVDEEPGQDLEASAERLGRARELVREGKIEEAMELYREIVSDHPQSLKARNNLGVLYDELGQHERALEQFEMARALVPENVEVLSNLGAALLGLSRYEEAERELRRAQKIDPENVEVRSNLGILYHRRGLYAQAETELRWVCERDHDHGPAHFYRGEALNRLGRVDQALEVLERAMRLQPANAKIYHTMGILYDKKRMPTEAAQMYRKMRELRN
jgi:tetratricopeptide (TPR) repeat protein